MTKQNAQQAIAITEEQLGLDNSFVESGAAEADAEMGALSGNFQSTVDNITQTSPTAMYGMAMIRPSLSLAQGHSIALLQGMDVTIYEYTLEQATPGFTASTIAMTKALYKYATEQGCTVSTETGLRRGNSPIKFETLRIIVRKGKEIQMIVLGTDSKMIVHVLNSVCAEDGPFHKGFMMVNDFAMANAPVEVGYIHALSYNPQQGIDSQAVPNKGTPKIVNEAYPFMDVYGGAEALIDNYLDSGSAVLNLYGKPGTGKSTLMCKAALRSNGRHVILVDNPIFYTDPGASTALVSHVRQLSIEGKRPLVLLEESDEYVKSKNNNLFLPQLLSLTSGVIVYDLKVVMATNLLSKDGILDALRRNGRSFANIEFRKLTPEEATKCHVAFDMPGELVERSEYTLSEILACEVINVGTNRQGMGFQG